MKRTFNKFYNSVLCMFPHFRREQEQCLSMMNVSSLEERIGGPSAGECFFTFGDRGGTSACDKCFPPLSEGMAIC
jgi:hypothetical protein